MDRILAHIEKKGAKWTKAHKPVKPIPYHQTFPGMTTKDENELTIQWMAKHGIENVRGGDWCMVKMYPRTVKELEGLVKKSKPSKGQTCDRCGRESHKRAKCYARTTVDGVTITTKSWKFRPKGDSKSASKKGRRRKRPLSKNQEHLFQHLMSGGSKDNLPEPKRRPKLKVACARCYRVGHESKDCTMKTARNPNSLLVKMEIQGLPIR